MSIGVLTETAGTFLADNLLNLYWKERRNVILQKSQKFQVGTIRMSLEANQAVAEEWNGNKWVLLYAGPTVDNVRQWLRFERLDPIIDDTASD